MSEEKSPLLLAGIDDTGGHFDNGSRGKNISAGAANIISQWPGIVRSLCVLLLAMMLFMTIVLFLLFFNRGTSFLVDNSICSPSKGGSQVIHLVHFDEFWTEGEMKALEAISRLFPGRNITLLLLTRMHHYHDNSTDIYDNITSILQTAVRNSTSITTNPSIGNSSLHRSGVQDALDRSLNKILERHPLLVRLKISTDDYFATTMLRNTWHRLSDKMVIFAARLNMLWEHGGISFHLPNLAPDVTDAEQDYDYSISESKYTSLITNSIKTINSVPENQVSVDNAGLHLSSKVSCHALFAKMLRKVETTNQTTMRTFLADVLKDFCTDGYIEKSCCDNVVQQNSSPTR